MRRSKDNSAYFGTDRRILLATSKVLKEKHCLGVKVNDISREAGIANSSFYSHYKSLSDIIDKNEPKILLGLDHLVEREKDTKNLEEVYRNILLFLFKHRELLDIVMRTDNIELLQKVLDKLKPFITRHSNHYGEEADQRIFCFLKFECMAELYMWFNEDFSIDKLDVHAHRLTYLSVNSARLFSQIYYK